MKNYQYRCFDCGKDLGDLKVSEEVIDRTPKGLDGSILLLCDKCFDTDEDI